MGDALKDLEDADAAAQQMFTLLKQADSEVERVIASWDSFHKEHGQKVEASPALLKALEGIQDCMHNALDNHLTYQAQIDQAKTDAQKALDESPL